MTDGVKAIIVIGVCFLFLVIVAVCGAAYWWSRHSKDLGRAAVQKFEEGRSFGKTTDNQGCVDEALARYKKSPGFRGAISANLFLQSCLDSSKPTPGFCESVPRRIDFMKSAAWQKAKCSEAGINDSMCPQIFAQLQQYCERGPRPQFDEEDKVFSPQH